MKEIRINNTTLRGRYEDGESYVEREAHCTASPVHQTHWDQAMLGDNILDPRPLDDTQSRNNQPKLVLNGPGFLENPEGLTRQQQVRLRGFWILDWDRARIT